MTKADLPAGRKLAWPTLRVLDDLGGTASIELISRNVVEYLAIPEGLLAIPHGNGTMSEFEYRGAWARSTLKKIGALENPGRGIWSITELGRGIRDEGEVLEMMKGAWRGPSGPEKKKKPLTPPPPADRTEFDWRDELLGTLREMEPSAFERLCQQFLFKSGFLKVEVTSRTRDGGIDGSGVLRVNLISFSVLFQCKRYTGAVTPREIRDFRGAMVGRADKGLFITTGTFTDSASEEAIRDGAPAIDLISGTELCDHLKQLKLGVSTRTEEVVEIDKEYFSSIEK